ncbi:MAG: autotransporter domain-containing protein [Pseudomonadota bacterium]
MSAIFRRLLASAALVAAPAYVPTEADAQDITDDLTTPVLSSTVNSGAPGDVIIAGGGSITLESTPNVTGVTINTDNDFDNEGLISLEETNGSVAVRIAPGLTTDFRNDGAIRLIEDFTREDDDNDDDLDGPLAIGDSRIGVLLEAGGAMTGTFDNDFGGAITVEGNNSAAIVLRSALNGDFINDGGVSVIGDQARGVDIEQGVTGDVRLSSSLTAQGEGAVGVRVLGDVGGAFSNDNNILTTGFTSTTISNYVDPDTLDSNDTPIEERRDPDDLFANEVTVAVGGSVADGFLNNGNIDRFLSQEDLDDEIKDTIEDFDENRGTGNITSVGSGPAVLISPDLDPSRNTDIFIGPVVESVRDTTDDDEDDDIDEIIATFTSDFGFINRGDITGNGLNIGFDATAVRIEGSADGALSTTIAGGLENTGSIQADAFEADAQALVIGRGATVPLIDNGGIIDADVFTEGANIAEALVIEEGATVISLINDGRISASSRGFGGTAIAIQDASGTLAFIDNTGDITAQFIDDNEEDFGLGELTAIDLSARGEGEDVRIRQFFTNPVDDLNGDDVIDLDDVNTPLIEGRILLGGGSDTLDIDAGEVLGDVSFGAGDDRYLVDNATALGDVAFGLGADLLEVTGGGVFSGAVTDADGALSIRAIDSDVQIDFAGPLGVTDITASGDTTLGFQFDPQIAEGTPVITATGVVDIDASVTLEAVPTRVITETTSVTLLQAPTLEVDAQAVTSSFLYNATFTPTATTLELEISPRTPDELGLTTFQAGAYDAILDLFGSSDSLGEAFAGITNEDEFIDAYNQALPISTEAGLRALLAINSSASGIAAERIDLLRSIPDRGVSFWAQQYWTYSDVDGGNAFGSYDNLGVTIVGGADRAWGDASILGAYLSFNTTEADFDANDFAALDITIVQAGGYFSTKFGALDVDVAGAIGWTSFDSERRVDFLLPDEDFDDGVINGEWGGLSTSGSVRVAYDRPLGGWMLRPTIAADYASINQNSYNEIEATALGVAAQVGDSNSSVLNASAILSLRRPLPEPPNEFDLQRVRRGLTFAPGAYVGGRSAVAQTRYAPDVAFDGGNILFELDSQEEFGEAAIFGFSLEGGGGGYRFSLNYDGAYADDLMEHQLGASFRITF